MKKLFSIFIAVMLTFSACIGLSACNKGGDDTPTEPTSMTYKSYTTQKAAIDEIISKTSDIAVVEKAFIDYYLNSNKDAELTILTGEDFTFESEQIVMAVKKDSNVDDYINAALYKFQQEEITINYTNGEKATACDLSFIATDKGLNPNLIPITAPQITTETTPESGSEFARILEEGFKIGFVVDGMTREENNQPFAGNSHFGGNDGFEVLLCRAIAKIYGKTVKSENEQTIEYSVAAAALDSGAVDILIGGRSSKDWGDDFDFSVPYLSNSQVIVVRTADKDKYDDYSKMKEAKFTAAKNSKGEALIKGVINDKVFGK
jgi:ABC-type amino acid transport substrate-binding protein